MAVSTHGVVVVLFSGDFAAEEFAGGFGVGEHGLDRCKLLLRRLNPWIVTIFMHFVTKFAFAAILSTIKQSLGQVNFLLYQLINTFTTRHHE